MNSDKEGALMRPYLAAGKNPKPCTLSMPSTHAAPTGILDIYPNKMVHVNIDPNSKPVHARPYLVVPHVHLHSFKNELDYLVKLGLLVLQQ